MEFIMNGQGSGAVATTLLNNNFDVAALRPWIGNDGRSYISRLGTNGKLESVPLQNATATLRREEWIQLDTAIVMAAKERLRAVADLRAAGLTFNIPNGMGKTVLESETMSDITPAIVSMDPARESEGDRPEFGINNLPLPVIHKDFYFNARQVATSRNNGAGIDTSTAQAAARRVSEEAEKLVIGTGGTISYGGGSVYGMINFPGRITSAGLTSPSAPGWTPQVMIREILALRQASISAGHYGPWILYTSPAFDLFLDDDYSTLKGDNTLRQRISVVSGISAIRTLDHLPGEQMILIQQTSDTIRLVIGMDITTLQWETHGGMRLNFKVMAIMVPQLRGDFYGNTGIVHANTEAS
jgi:uncharacterized linocin/CFP29 family protein